MTSEEVNKDGIHNLLNMIPSDLNGLERAVVCNDGTVQTMLSAIFYAPVKVNVVSQFEGISSIKRDVELIAIHSNEHKKTVCRASSIIRKKGSPLGFLTGIREGKMGIGQLISSIGLNTKRDIISMDSNDTHFTRCYKIREILTAGESGDGLSITIIETFPRELYAIKGV